jgi:hypothetical protein
MSKRTTTKAMANLKMQMSPMAKRMVVSVLSRAIEAVNNDVAVSGDDLGIVCSHLRAISEVVHSGDVEPFEMGLNGDTIHPKLAAILQHAIENATT